MHTEDNPGCYHSMLNYLSEKSGISVKKDIIIKNIDDLKGKKGKLIYRSNNITVIATDGSSHPYMLNAQRFDLRGIIPDHFVVSVPRSPQEFNIPIEKVGNYKDSLGGGWYSNVDLYKIDDQYFAMMECTCIL